MTALPAQAARPADPWVPGCFEIDYLTPERDVSGVLLEEAADPRVSLMRLDAT